MTFIYLIGFSTNDDDFDRYHNFVEEILLPCSCDVE